MKAIRKSRHENESGSFASWLDVAATLLLLSLVVSMLTFALERTNILLGAVHLLLFLAYLMLIFQR